MQVGSWTYVAMRALEAEYPTMPMSASKYQSGNLINNGRSTSVFTMFAHRAGVADNPFDTALIHTHYVEIICSAESGEHVLKASM